MLDYRNTNAKYLSTALVLILASSYAAAQGVNNFSEAVKIWKDKTCVYPDPILYTAGPYTPSVLQKCETVENRVLTAENEIFLHELCEMIYDVSIAFCSSKNNVSSENLKKEVLSTALEYNNEDKNVCYYSKVLTKINKQSLDQPFLKFDSGCEKFCLTTSYRPMCRLIVDGLCQYFNCKKKNDETVPVPTAAIAASANNGIAGAGANDERKNPADIITGQQNPTELNSNTNINNNGSTSKGSDNPQTQTKPGTIPIAAKNNSESSNDNINTNNTLKNTNPTPLLSLLKNGSVSKNNNNSGNAATATITTMKPAPQVAPAGNNSAPVGGSQPKTGIVENPTAVEATKIPLSGNNGQNEQINGVKPTAGDNNNLVSGTTAVPLVKEIPVAVPGSDGSNSNPKNVAPTEKPQPQPDVITTAALSNNNNEEIEKEKVKTDSNLNNGDGKGNVTPDQGYYKTTGGVVTQSVNANAGGRFVEPTTAGSFVPKTDNNANNGFGFDDKNNNNNGVNNNGQSPVETLSDKNKETIYNTNSNRNNNNNNINNGPSGFQTIGGDEAVPSSGHFFAYFLTAVVICISGYVIFHNKQKILAFIVEGRSGVEGGRRRGNGGVQYSKLSSNVEEVMPSLDKESAPKSFVY